MSNINKILITIVSCVFMISVASVSIVSIVTSDKNDTTATTSASQVQQPENTTVAPPTSVQEQITSQSAAVKPQTDSATTTTSASTEALTTTVPAATGNLETDILGLWMDSAGMSGYEFLEDGRFNWTYVDLAGFGVPFNGKTSGVYTLEGDTLTIKFSIYSATIKRTYKVTIAQNELSMYDLEERETATYVRTVAQ